MHGVALSQSGALVLTVWAALISAVATVVLALFALFPARSALGELRASRDQRGWRVRGHEKVPVCGQV